MMMFEAVHKPSAELYAHEGLVTSSQQECTVQGKFCGKQLVAALCQVITN
jgi:hypothetical protein